MAQRRMFSKDITENDSFLDMPLSTQALYFHLGMQADDDGFVSPNRIVRMLGCQADDLRILVAKKFAILLDYGVVVIKHWKINNYIQKDRKKPTTHQEKLAMLTVKSNNGYKLDTECIQNVRVGKYSIGKDRIGEVRKVKANKREQSSLVEDIDIELSNLLVQEIKNNLPTFKEPNIDSWSNHVSRMRRLDNRTPEQIEYVIRWCQQDDFWQANILSTKKLREKFDQLVGQIKRQKTQSKPKGLKIGSITK